MDVALFGSWFVITAAVLGLVVGSRFERSRWRQRLTSRGLDPENLRPLDSGDVGELGTVRQDRLEQAVEAIGIEVERISENQRFVTKLLAERGSPNSGKRNTPISPVPGTLPARDRPA